MQGQGSDCGYFVRKGLRLDGSAKLAGVTMRGLRRINDTYADPWFPLDYGRRESAYPRCSSFKADVKLLTLNCDYVELMQRIDCLSESERLYSVKYRNCSWGLVRAHDLIS